MKIAAVRSWLQKKLNADDENDINMLIVQFIKFGLVGVSNTLISWICYYGILWFDNDLYMVGGAVGTVVSIANAFFWNEHFVFKDGDRDFKSKFKRLIKTYISYGGTSALSMLLLWIEVDHFGLSKVFVPPLNLIITIPLNFILNKFWTFRKARSKVDEK